MNEIKHDEDGFLLPEKNKQDIEQILENTEKLLQQSFRQPRKPRNNIASIQINTPKQPKPNIQTAKKQPENTAKAVAKAITQQSPRANPIQKREQKDRSTALREAKVQTELLTKIASGQSQSKNNGLFSLLGLGGGLAKGLFKSPFNFLRGGKNAMMRGVNGRFLPKGTEKIGRFGKMGRIARGFAKGGLAAALFGLLDGVSVENSNMSRTDKNKTHVKNLAVGAGGVGGALAGAAIGSIVPVVGTTIGAILGGFGGAALMETWTEKLDDAIDPELSKKMFGSWKGLTNILSTKWTGLTSGFSMRLNEFSDSLNTMAAHVWNDLMPSSITTYFENLNSWGKASWDNFSKSASNWFESIKKVAAPVVENLQNAGAAAIDWTKEKIQTAAETFGVVTEAEKERREKIAKNIDLSIETVKNSGSLNEEQKKSAIAQYQKIKENILATGNVDGTQTTLQQAGGSVQAAGAAAIDWTKEKVQDIKQSALSLIGYDMTKKYANTGYIFGGNDLNRGIDCSHWTFQIQKMETKELSRMTGRKFEEPIYRTSEGQIKYYSDKYGVVTDQRDKGGIDFGKIKAGMLIGQHKFSNHYQGNGGVKINGYGHTRYNHIAKVIVGQDGQLYVSESQGGGKRKGVTLTSLEKWFSFRQKRGDNLTVVNPYGNDIDLLNGKLGAIANAAAGRTAQAAQNVIQSGVESVIPSADAANLPVGGKGIKDFITKGESFRKGWSPYDVGNKVIGVYANGKTRYGYSEEKLSQLTIREVMKLQEQKRVFAAGRYQIIPKTLIEAVNGTGTSLDAKFDAQTQEALANYLLTKKRAKIANYIRTGQGFDAAALGMAQEWASVPLLGNATRKGDKGKVYHMTRGQSFYSDNGTDKAHHKPEDLEKALTQAHNRYDLALKNGANDVQAMDYALSGLSSSASNQMVATTSAVKISIPLKAKINPPKTRIDMPKVAPVATKSISPTLEFAKMMGKQIFSNIAHQSNSTSRTVSHQRIAHNASGGIMDGQN